jgi:hypothetical protein
MRPKPLASFSAELLLHDVARLRCRPRSRLGLAHGAASAPGTPLGCQLQIKPSRVGFRAANLALPVTSSWALCVRVDRKGAEKKG